MDFQVVAFTHRTTPIEKIGGYHLPDDVRVDSLADLKQKIGSEELMYLSTCNRVEFILCGAKSDVFKTSKVIKCHFKNEEDECEVYEGAEAIMHLFKVASSVDSAVVGEREIITQVRQAYEQSRALGLAGDNIRVLIRKTIELAKKVYTETSIGTNPVSVVSLAHKQLAQTKLNGGTKVLVIGSGEMNQNMTSLLIDSGFKEFTVYNRSLENAQKLANTVKGKAFALDQLKEHKAPFDLIVTCTGSADRIITPEIYSSMLSDKGQKVIIDLAVPADVDPEVIENNNIHYINVESVKEESNKNLALRQKELLTVYEMLEDGFNEFDKMFRERQLEKAMSDIPREIKQIKEYALNKVFSEEIENLDEESKELLENILSFVEKKYISKPMKMAKDIILKH